jgi:hypothetical protein
MGRRRRNEERIRTDVPNEVRKARRCPTPSIAASRHWAATGPVPYRRPRRGAPTRSVREQRPRLRLCVARLHLWFGWPVRCVCLFVSLLVCLYAGLFSLARLVVRLPVFRLFVCLFVCPVGLLGSFVSVLLGCLRPQFWGALCRCGTSAAQTSTRRARAQAGVQVGTHSTHWTLRSMMQSNPIITAAGATTGVL